MSTKRRSATVFGACWVCERRPFSKDFHLLSGEEYKASKIEAEMGIHEVVWMGFISNG